MSETTLFSPEGVDDSFSFQIGENKFGFKGGLTEGKFSGMIRGADGQEFAGLVEDLGGGRYKVEDWESGRMFEPSNEQPTPAMADVPVGFDDAVMAASMDEAQAEAAAGAEPQPVQAEPAAETTAELPLPVEPEPGAAEELAAEAVQPPAPEPAPEPEIVPEPAVVELPAPAPEPVAEPAGAPEKASKENRHPLIVDLQQKMQGVYRPFQAARLWKQAEAIRAEVSKTRSEKKVGELLAEEGKLKRQAEELNPGIEKMTEAERKKLSLESVPLSAEGATEAIRISSPRHREDMAVLYDTELQKWENVFRNSADFEQYRTAAAEIETKKNEARKLFSGESDKKLLNRAIAQIDQTGSGQLKELEAKLPQRLLELAGFTHSEPPTLGQAESDVDLRLAYNRAAQQLYAELIGQPQTVAETVTAPMPELEPELAPEPILPPEPVVTEPVVETTVEVTPQAEPEPAPAAMKDSPTQVTIPAVEEEAAPSEPIAAPAAAPEAVGQGQGQVVVDAAEQAMVSGMPVEAPVEAAPDSSSDAEVPEWLVSPATAPMPEGSAASTGAPVMAPAEVSAQPEVAAETPEQRSERRKLEFAGALGGLDRARGDTSGTEREQIVRLAEAYNQAIGAAMEFMEEGDVAKNVVKGFLAGALGTSTGQKLTEVAVRSRMDEAGVTGAPVGEKKKKLEEAGLLGLLELLLELGMNFTDKTIGAVVTEVQSATGGGR